ncbi:olfactory protein-like [Pelodytes ibericus]
MALALLSLALALLLAGGIQAEISVQKDFDINRFGGKWYGLLVVSNNTDFLKMKDGMTRPVLVFTAQPDKSLNADIGFMTPKGCQQRHVHYKHVSDGIYTLSMGKGVSTVVIVGTDYTGNALEAARTVYEDGKVTTMLRLYGRHTGVSKQIQDHFEQICGSMGLKKEDTVVFPNGEECVPDIV